MATNRNKTVILICGLPGCGKTSLSQALNKTLNFPVLSTEGLRAKIFNYSCVKQDKDFSKEELQITYKTISVLADLLLNQNLSIIVEGVFRSDVQRKLITDLRSNGLFRFIKVFLHGRDEEIIKRLELRMEIGSIAPAGSKSYYKIKDNFELVDSEYLKFDTTVYSTNEISEIIINLID